MASEVVVTTAIHAVDVELALAQALREHGDGAGGVETVVLLVVAGCVCCGLVEDEGLGKGIGGRRKGEGKGGLHGGCMYERTPGPRYLCRLERVAVNEEGRSFKADCTVVL